MSTGTTSRRRQRRYTIGDDRTASVEFEYPSSNGRAYRLPLINISKSGISFALDDHDELATLDPGTRVEGAVVKIGDCAIHGELVLMHLTADAGSHALCGALFFPTSDRDLIVMRSVVAGMEAIAAD